MVKSSTTVDQAVNTVLEQVAVLPVRIVAWREDTDEYLTSLIRKAQRQRNNDPSLLPLGLATSFFQCKGCTELISYPRILMHNCFMLPSGVIGDSNGKTLVESKKKKNVPREPRPMKQITADTMLPSLSMTFGEGMHPGRTEVAFHRAASQSASRIILCCGENPGTITYKEMDQKDFRVECLLCSSAGRGRLVMRWTIAVS